MTQERSAQAIEQKKKQKKNETKQRKNKKNAGSVIYNTDQENKADKMFTVRLSI